MNSSPEMVRIPRTSTRASQRFFAKLLTRVDPNAATGFGFEGTILRPGSMIPLSALWPTPAHPAIPIVLEYAGNPNPVRGPARRLQPDTYVLWRFDPEKKTWSEIARALGEGWTWAIDMRAIAIRALEESIGTAVEVFSGLNEVLVRMRQLLDQEIHRLPPPDRPRAVAVLHDEFSIRLAQFTPIDARFSE